MWLDWSRKYLKESGDESPAEPEVPSWGGRRRALGIPLIFIFDMTHS